MKAWVWLLAAGLVACGDGGKGGGGAAHDAAPGPGFQGEDAAAHDAAIRLLDAMAPDLGRPDAAADAGDAAPPDGRGTLRIQPDMAELHVVMGMPATLQLQAVRAFQGGRTTPIPPALIQWLVDPPDLGAVAQDTGVFTATGTLGDARVYAQQGDDVAVATIHLIGEQDVLEPGTPADAPDRFANAGEGQNCAPQIEYPEPFTAFPRNIQGVTFQWEGSGHDLFEAEFSAGGSVGRWYTTETELTPGGDTWTRLLNAAAGGQLRFTLRGLGGAGNDACAAPEQVYLIDTSTLQGAVYYWSTTDFGIMRLAAGDTAPEPLLNPSVAPEINCPACHALSRTGARIAFTRTTFPPFGDLMVSDIANPRMAAYNPTGVVGYFPSWAPDDRHLVAGAGGRLVIRDADTGMETGSLTLPQGMVGGSPDWAWDGSRIVAVLGPSNLNPIPDVGVTRGSLAEWTLGADGTWGQANVLVPQADTENNDRPAYSPDGRFVAFTRHDDAAQGSGMGNPTNALWAFDAQRGGAPVQLTRANGPQFAGNSWPKWSPIHGGGNRLWLAFSSVRSYGHLLRNGSQDPRPQIWVTGIDPAQADQGQDPSSPAFWLPYQGIGSGNHIPYWAPYEKQPR
jgi:hypothetical protein